MREQHQLRLRGLDRLLQCDAISIGRVGFEQVVLDLQDFRYIFPGKFCPKRVDAFADQQRRHRT